MHIPRMIATSGAIAGVLAVVGAAYVYVTTRGSGTRTFGRGSRPSPIRLTAASAGEGFAGSEVEVAVPSSGTNDDAAAADPFCLVRRGSHPAGSGRAVVPVVVHEAIDVRHETVVHASLQPHVLGVARDARSSAAVTLMLSSN